MEPVAKIAPLGRVVGVSTGLNDAVAFGALVGAVVGADRSSVPTTGVGRGTKGTMLVAFATKHTLGVIVAGGQMVVVISMVFALSAGQLMTGVAHAVAVMTVT